MRHVYVLYALLYVCGLLQYVVLWCKVYTSCSKYLLKRVVCGVCSVCAVPVMRRQVVGLRGVCVVLGMRRMCCLRACGVSVFLN